MPCNCSMCNCNKTSLLPPSLKKFLDDNSKVGMEESRRVMVHEERDFLREMFNDTIAHIGDLTDKALDARKTHSGQIDFYQAWMATMFKLMVDAGIMTREEIESRYGWDMDWDMDEDL